MNSTKQRKQAVQLLTAVGIVVLLVFGAFAYKKVTRPNVGKDNCLYEDKALIRKESSEQTIVVVDQSEALSVSHKRQVKDILLDYFADEGQLPIRASVVFYAFGKNDFSPAGAGQTLQPVVQLCRPPTTGNEVFENKRKLERTFRDQFVIPLYETLDRSLDVSLGERSPILEMLQYISRTQDIKESSFKSKKKTLILVSDLLQHSSVISHYKGAAYQDFLKSASMLKSDLRGWSVRILYLQRYGKDQALQNRQLDEFWMRYFQDAGAKIERMARLP